MMRLWMYQYGPSGSMASLRRKTSMSSLSICSLMGSIEAEDDVETLHDDVGHKPPFHLLAEFGKWLVDMSRETRDDKEDRRSIEQKELLEPG